MEKKLNNAFTAITILSIVVFISILSNYIQYHEYNTKIVEVKDSCRTEYTSMQLKSIAEYYGAVSVIEYAYEYASIDTTDVFDKHITRMMKAQILGRNEDVLFYKREVGEVIKDQYIKNGKSHIKRMLWK